jgi:hypothetical protein
MIADVATAVRGQQEMIRTRQLTICVFLLFALGGIQAKLGQRLF